MPRTQRFPILAARPMAQRHIVCFLIFSALQLCAAEESRWTDLFSGSNQTRWAQSGPGKFTLQKGIATAEGGMGLWWYTNQLFTNFVLRGEFMQMEAAADSGVFVRFPNPGNDPWAAVKAGHEMEIGDANPEKPTWRTGSIYPFQASSEANTKGPGQWNVFELSCSNQTYVVRMNGQFINHWTDPKRRSSFGYVGLQNYNDGKTVKFRNLRVRNLE